MMKKGQTLIEVIVAIAVTSALLPALITAYVTARSGEGQEATRLLGAARAREAKEILSVIKEDDWSSVATNGIYHLASSAGVWSLQSGTETLDNIITRSIAIDDAFRDENGVLAPSGTLDPSTKRITITSAWSSFVPSAVTLDYYLMRLENLSHVETTESDFEAGTLNGTTVTNTSGGEVTLGAGGSADWCDPHLTISAYDLPKSGVANAISAVEGQVLAGTGENASGVSMANVLISNVKPPVASSDSTYDGFKTNAVFTTGTYAYLATDTNNKEIDIVNLDQIVNGKFTEAGYYNAPTNGNANGIYVNGQLGFTTIGSDLFVFDTSGLPNTTSSRGTKASISLSGTGGRLVVSGNYIYVTITSGSNALQIIEFANDGSSVTLTPRGQVTLGSNQAGRDVVVNATSTRAFLIAEQHASQPEFYVVDINSKEGSRPVLGSYNSGSMQPKGVAVVTAGKAIMVGSGDEEYQVVGMTDNTDGTVSIGRCGGLQIDTGVNGVAGIVESDGDAYAYIVTGDASAELKIIEGGPGGQLAISGTYESAAFDAGRSSVFNRFDLATVTPMSTSIRTQVALTSPVAGSCENAAYIFVGPDKTTNTYFLGSAQLPLGSGSGYTNPGQCLKYKAFLESLDNTVAPTLLDITFNYSP